MFTDAKRAITKDLLMRIGLKKIIEHTDYTEFQNTSVSLAQWIMYKSHFKNQTKGQLNLFADM
jgi:hypothetical protein